MINKNLVGIKRYRFFETEKPQKLSDESGLNFTLNDMIPFSFKIYDNYYYVIGKLKKDEKTNNEKLFRIFKVHPCGKIISQYIPYTDSILDFTIIQIPDGKAYLILLGTDLKKEDDKSKAIIEIKDNDSPIKIQITPSSESIPSIKFFDLNLLSEQSDTMKPNKVIYLMHKKDKINDIYKENDLSSLTDVYVPIKNISAFNISSNMSSLAISSENYLIEILLDFSKKDKKKINIINSPDNKNITNIKYISDIYIYFTTTHNTYFKKIGDEKLKMTGDQSISSGANPQNFDINDNRKIILSTSVNYFIEEYVYDKSFNGYEKQGTKVFERKIKFMQFYKNNFLFILYEEEKKPALCVYDIRNNIFLLIDESYYHKDILYMINDNERIYILYCDGKKTDIKIMKEMGDREKFESFYSKQNYDIAYSYGKYLGFDKGQLAEIAKAHAEFLYKKGDYAKSIEQYILTINYLDPKYVIDKFIEGSKKDFLIEYLEELQANKTFRSIYMQKNPKRLKDYTGLLLNIYIRKKEFEKFKNFVEKKNINDLTTISTAIEVCKETNNIDLALHIAEKAKIEESYIQILIEIKNDVNKSLDYISKMTDIEKKFEIIITYGEKLLEKKEKINDTMKMIYKLIDDIIDIKGKNKMDKKLKNLNYEKITTIFLSEDSKNLLEKLLIHIMEKDPDCPKEIILKRIELYIDNYNEEKSEENKKYWINKIKEILNDEDLKEKIDKNYLLMLFKISGCIEGEAELNKFMDLNQDLLQLYMEKQDYENINNLCDNAMNKNSENKKNNNYWLEALNYYINISEKKNIQNLEKIGVYLTKILENLSNSKENELSPMSLLDILQKAGAEKKIIKMKFIREFFKNWVKKRKSTIFDDEKEAELNHKKIEEFEKKFKNNKYLSKTFSGTNKCSNCGGSLDEPFVFFICGHGYHQSCLDEEIECIVCKDKFKNILDKFEDGKKIAKENKFIDEINHTDNEKKYDVFANYFGKAVFIKENEKIENKDE